MSKPSHTVVLTKLVLYFNFLLWQLGAHRLKFQARADALLPDDEEFKILDEELSPLYIALIAIGSTIIAALVLLAFTWLLRSRNSLEIRVSGAKTGKGTRDKVVTLEELIDATGKFSDKTMIGSGSFGTVYVAQLQGPNRSTVAVKRLYSHFEEGAPKLKMEITRWVYGLHHENLIKLYDYHNEKDSQLLVYEYMENLSLEDALTVDSGMRSLKFTWDTRFKICLGIARGLVYLHNHPRLHTAHMNIKAGNILLDEELEPKITDFGLGHLYVEEDQFKLIKTAVSQGYMAPEYFQDSLTMKADVYSFGVILLEIVSWKKNEFKSRHGSEFLVDTAHKKYEQGNLEDIIDEALVTYDEKQAMTILKLAVMCTSMSPNMRPSMSEVLSVLLKEKTTDEFIRSMPSSSYPSTETKYEMETISEDIPVRSRNSITIKEGEEKTRKGSTGEILVTLKELIDATGKFSNKKIIGSDSLGTVYVAPLQVSTNVTVAVKSLSSNFRRNFHALRKEIKFLYTLDHENILKLFDFHIEKDYRLLVYEYIECKSLEDALNSSSDTRLKFTWDTRFKICLGIAMGLEYLHNHRRQSIVHMDIRPGNILLDGDLEPKISGFGMACLSNSVEADQFNCNIKVASRGYMAPEVFRGVLTIKADVYSFGIILLEIVSWQTNVPRNPCQEFTSLLDEAHMLHNRGRLQDMIDRDLPSYDSKQALTILNLALKCTNRSPNLRPSMSEVVSVLLNKKTIDELKSAGDLAYADTSIPSTSSPFTDTKYELDTISVHSPTKL